MTTNHFKEIAKRLIVALVIFTTVIWSVGMPFFKLILPADAAVEVTVSTQSLQNMEPNASIGIASQPTAAVKIGIGVYATSSAQTLTHVTAYLGGGGFVPGNGGDLANLNGAAPTSGVALYNDLGTTSPGYFGDGDAFIPLSGLAWAGSSVTLMPTSAETLPVGTSTYYVVIRTSSTAVPGHQIVATIPANGVVTSDMNGPNNDFYANNFIIDNTGPAVAKAEVISSTMIDVYFNERIMSTSTATSSFAFSPAVPIMSAWQDGSSKIRLTTGAAVTASTTLTVFAGILDMAGNPGGTQSSIPLGQATNIKISEAGLIMNGDPTAQFVEWYNGSGSSTDISNWRLEYSNASPINWITIATVPASTTMAAYGYYLFGTSQFNSLAFADGDTLFSATSTGGGHFRIMSASSTQFDKLGWGGATYPEGAVASPFTTNNSLERKAFGGSTATSLATGGTDVGMGNSWDTENNYFDFVTQTSPNPQNSASSPESPAFVAGGGPGIYHMSVNLAPLGSPLTIYAQMGDPIYQASLNAQLLYMIGDGTPNNGTTSQYTAIAGTAQANGYFRFTIPQSTVDGSTANGIYYYLKVTTPGGQKLMSASPTADATNLESSVAQNPFIISVQNPISWPNKHSITGTITDASSSPISSALILLEGTSYSTSTLPDGSFVLPDVKDGNYNMVIVKNGYYESWFNNLNLFGNNFSLGNYRIFSGTGGGAGGDTSRPRVNWTGPADGMTGLPSGATSASFKIFIGLSKNLDGATFNNANVFLTTDGVTPIGSTVLYDNATSSRAASWPQDPYLGVVWAPGGGLSPNTTYYLVMTGAVRDTIGNSLEGNRSEGGQVVSFSTGGDYSASGGGGGGYGSGGVMPPFVIGVTPNQGLLNVPQNTRIFLSFNEPMDMSTILPINLKLEKITYSGATETKTTISAGISLDTSQKVVRLTPIAALTAGKYRLTVTGALRSANGIYMGNPDTGQNLSSFEVYRSDFEVGSATDTTSPTVYGTWPISSTNNTNIAVNPGAISIQFSDAMDPSTITANSLSLKRGNSPITGEIEYDAMSHTAFFAPTVALSTNAQHTLTIVGDSSATSSAVADAAGNHLASDYQVAFYTASSSDTLPPKIMFAKGDDFGLAVTFNEPMNSAKIIASSSWPTSVLNKNNYIIKQGAYNSDFATGFTSATSTLDLANAFFYYEPMSNTLMIENLAGVVGQNYYIQMASSSVIAQGGGGAADLSGNPLVAMAATFQTPAEDSQYTKGMLGPNMMGTSGMMGPDMGMMGMMKAGAFPMNPSAGITTVYFVDLPTAFAVANGYKLVLTFPAGFDLSAVKKDPYSPINNDLNEWNAGSILFATTTETSGIGGANNDGVTVDTAANTVTITLVVTGTPPTGDFLHLDLAGIRNSAMPRGFDTSGYQVDMKIMKADGTLSETIAGMPFFITAGGSLALNGTFTLTGGGGGTNGTTTLYLGSPLTGPMSQDVVITAGSGSYSFSSLAAGQYMLFTDPTIAVAGGNWTGLSMPEAIYLNASTTKNLAFTQENAGAVTDLTVNLAGDFKNADIDVFAGSPSGFKVKTISAAGVNPAAIHLYLPAGDWMIGVGPAMPKGTMSGPPPMPDWMPPMPQTFRSTGAGSGAVTLTVSNANLQIIGYVREGTSTPVADAEVYAYQPGNATGMGAHAKTDTAGKFILKIATTSPFTIGVYKPGLPFIPERSALVTANNASSTDDNNTADIFVDGRLVTAINQFLFKFTKPNRNISGKVTNGTAPVAYAPVWADKVDAFGHTDAMTDASGNYILYVDAGAWRVQSYIPGVGNAETKLVVVGSSDLTQNLAPETGVTYYNINGAVTINGQSQNFRPIRAAQFTSNGAYTGKEYHGQTDSTGNYSLSVPGSNNYRVDIWTPEYGEVGLDTDEVADNPANIIVASADRSGRNITITAGNLVDLTLVLANKADYSGKEGFVNIDGVDCAGTCKSNGFHRSLRIADVSGSSQVVKLRATSSYFFYLDVPGVGSYLPTDRDGTTGTINSTSTNRSVNFNLPAIASTTVTISGAVTEGIASSSGAWVWIGDQASGYKSGAKTGADGSYVLSVPIGSNYKMGADKPGFVPGEPVSIVATSTIAGRNFNLTAKTSALTISGYLYKDLNSNSAYDVGEAVANGLVRAKSSDGAQVYLGQADGYGYYEIGVPVGTWYLYGLADGYVESAYNSSGVAISAANLTDKNIKLAVDSSWVNKSRMVAITPASGGTMDDTGTSSTGVKLTVPPNALGNSSAAGNISSALTAAVNKTNTSESFTSYGVAVTATDNSGQAINNLNDYIDLEMVLYKADVAQAITKQATSSAIVYDRLKKTTNGYWDSTANDWINLATTRIAYYKTAGDTEWRLATSSFENFIDTLISGTVYEDYKLVYTSKTNHLTIFMILMPFVALPAQASQAAPASPGSPGGGAGGGYYQTPCTNVVFEDWQTTCTNQLQYRSIKSLWPNGCILSAEQESQRKRSCGVTASSTVEKITTTVKQTVQTVKQTASTANKFISEAKFLITSSVKVFLAKLKLKMSAYRVNLYTRLYLNGMVKNVKGLTQKNKTTLIRFITYGSDSTKGLSVKQRVTALNQYKKITGKLPITEKEWANAIALALPKHKR